MGIQILLALSDLIIPYHPISALFSALFLTYTCDFLFTAIPPVEDKPHQLQIQHLKTNIKGI